ncbi:MAG: hypothetical protein D6714_08765, partial [Bacteroidetes bacterium]
SVRSDTFLFPTKRKHEKAKNVGIRSPSPGGEDENNFSPIKNHGIGAGIVQKKWIFGKKQTPMRRHRGLKKST